MKRIEKVDQLLAPLIARSFGSNSIQPAPGCGTCPKPQCSVASARVASWRWICRTRRHGAERFGLQLPCCPLVVRWTEGIIYKIRARGVRLGSR